MKTTRGLAQEHGQKPMVRRRLQLPLVECAHEARPDDEMTPARVAEVLLDEEAGSLETQALVHTLATEQ
jgi:hypothetical protein